MMQLQATFGGSTLILAAGTYLLGAFESSPLIMGGSAAAILGVQVWTLTKLIPIMVSLAKIEERLAAGEARDEQLRAEISKLTARDEHLATHLAKIELNCARFHGAIPPSTDHR